jgi:hypothetical protein
MTSGSAVRPHIASEAKPHVNVLVDVSVNVPDLAIFCPADRYLVACRITKNWMFTALLWSSSSLLLRFETGYPGETENSKISLSAHHYFAFRACDHTFSGTFTFTCTSMFTSGNTNFAHSIPRRALEGFAPLPWGR